MQTNQRAAAVRDSILKLIHDAITRDNDPSTLDHNTVNHITIGLGDKLARDRAMAFIYPAELAPALALWNHAAKVGEEWGIRMYTAPLHTLRSWTYWVSGDHLNACRAIHAALAIDTSYELAKALHQIMAHEETVPACLMQTVIEQRHLYPEGRD
ncbi:DUF4192 family protein [Streptomyces sp. NPDC057557]|uniref:DUF4192 family protein n=1 Tax=Streptomyces sp. NPDC057557 TaxID=3346167 RepID=UPI003695B708